MSFTFPGDVLVTFCSKQLGDGWDDICCRMYGTDGTLDTGFNPMPNGVVYAIALQPADGKPIIGGTFTGNVGPASNPKPNYQRFEDWTERPLSLRQR